MRKTRVSEAMRQTSVVGQKQQSLTVTVEPAGRIDAGHRHKRLQSRAAGSVPKLAEDAVRLVKSNVTEAV